MRGPNRKIFGTARRLRRNSTDAEVKLWFALRDRRLGGHKFVRQKAIELSSPISFAVTENSSSKSTAGSIRKTWLTDAAMPR